MRNLKQLFVFLAVVAVLVVAPAFAKPASSPMGIVTGAQHALVGQVAAANGTSLYDGDTVATEAAGAMRMRFGTSQMVLSGNTNVTLSKTESGVSATLAHGMVRFAITPGSLMEIHTLKTVVVSSKDGKPAIGQLSVVGTNSFQIGSSKGDLIVSVNGINHEVAESTAFNVNLDDSDSAPNGGGGTVAAGKSAGVWIAIAAIGAGTAVALALAFMSPSAP